MTVHPTAARTARDRIGGAWRALAVLAGVSVLVAGCGGGGSSPGVANGSTTTTTTGGSAPQTALADELRYASCMRSNGVTNYPDPGSSARPLSSKHIDLNSPAFQRAFTACRKYASNGGIGPPAPSAAQLRFALAFAQCVRKHGFLQFPDPLTTAPDPDQAEFTLGQGMYFPVNGGYQVMSPAFMHAAKACGVQL